VNRFERDSQVALLSAQGLQNKVIGQRLGIHFNTVTRILKRPEVQDLIAELRQQTRAQMVEHVAKSLAERVDEAAEDAFERLTELVRGAKSETVQFKAVESILDRSTTAPKREIHSSHRVDEEKRVIHLTLTAEDIAQLRSGIVLEEPEDMIDVTPRRSADEMSLPELVAAMKAEGERQSRETPLL
jgi:transposase